MRSRRAGSSAGGPKWLRTKKAGVGVISRSRASRGVARFCGAEPCWRRSSSAKPGRAIAEAAERAPSSRSSRRRIIGPSYPRTDARRHGISAVVGRRRALPSTSAAIGCALGHDDEAFLALLALVLDGDVGDALLGRG